MHAGDQLFDERSIRKDEVESLAHIFQELKNGFTFLKKYPKSVSIFGSARFDADNIYAKAAESLAKRIVEELRYAIITGGGLGIMQAANKGAYQAGGHSIGVLIRLPREQNTNPYLSDELCFRYFFTRKTILTFAAEAYVFFPGGFGTFDEFFEVITMIQTKKIPPVPIFLVGKDFWTPLHRFIEKEVYETHCAIDKTDMDLYTITDDQDVIIEHIKKAPVSRWWKHIERS